MNLKLKLLAAALPLAFAASSFAAEEPKKEEAPAPDWSWTGHVDVEQRLLPARHHQYLRQQQVDGAYRPPNDAEQ